MNPKVYGELKAYRWEEDECGYKVLNREGLKIVSSLVSTQNSTQRDPHI